MSQYINDFADAIAAAGLGHPEIMADGTLHRFKAENDRPGTRNAWYVMHLDHHPAGAFGSWRDGQHTTWSARADQPLTPRQNADIRRLVEQAKALRDAETRDRQAEAASRAMRQWDIARPPDPAHPYLVAKAIRPYGIRQLGGALLAPIYIDDRLASIQTILPDGAKRFFAGGQVVGGYWLIDAEPRRPEILVCEGVATGASLHEEIGARVYVGFTAGNLFAVARTVRAQHPKETIVVCADDDRWTDGNPGLTKARAAAAAIRGKILIPDFTGMDLTTKPTDWNDWYRMRRAAAGRVAA